MPKKRLFFLGCILLIAAISFIGYRAYHQLRQSASGQEASAVVDASALYKQYQDQEKQADLLYLGKVIQVTGVLSAITHDGGFETWVLDVGQPGAGINCQLFGKVDAKQTHKIGAKYSLKGKCTGFLMDVNLVDCSVVQN